jgi:uracil phosphoribosyltransferase
MKNVTVISHPLVQHNLARLRDKRTGSQEFRRLLGEIAALMTYEATRTFAVKKVTVQTPLSPCPGLQLEREVALVPVLRAGLGMLDAILDLKPPCARCSTTRASQKILNALKSC